MSPPRVRACMFDVDGLLINSEDIYTQQYNNVLRKHGAADLPWSLKALVQSTGKEGAQRILNWANLSLTTEQWADEVKEHRDLFRGSQPMPGVPELLANLSRRTSPPMNMAIASSSNDAAFVLKTSHLPSVTEPFRTDRRVFGNDPDMAGKSKKPAPDLFNIALDRINKTTKCDGEAGSANHITPQECLVFEDSIAGVEAARKAGMQVVWVPHPGLRHVAQGHEQAVLAGQISSDLTLMEPIDAPPLSSVETATSDDGFAVMLKSLTNFPYAHYGIDLI